MRQATASYGVSTSKVLMYGVDGGSGCVGNAGAGAVQVLEGLPNEGFPLTCELKDPITGPLLWALDLHCHQVATERINPGNILFRD